MIPVRSTTPILAHETILSFQNILGFDSQIVCTIWMGCEAEMEDSNLVLCSSASSVLATPTRNITQLLVRYNSNQIGASPIWHIKSQ